VPSTGRKWNSTDAGVVKRTIFRT